MLTTEWGTVRYPSCRDKGLVLVLVGVRPVCSTQSPRDRVATRTSTRPPPCPTSAPCPYRIPFGRQHSLGADLSAFAGCSAIPLNLLKLIIQHAGEGSEECACWNCII